MLNYFKHGKSALILFLSLFVISFQTPSQADLVVTESSSEDIKIGTTLPDNTPLRIPEGITIKILKTPENETYELIGPFAGTLKEYKKARKCTLWRRLTFRCKKKNGSSDPIGGVRGIKKT